MVAAAMGNTGIMTVFDFILIVYGIYSITTARKMRQDHQVPQWLVSQQTWCVSVSRKNFVN